ncbi:zinc dependent phospholipase C family protein [Alkalihalobacillus sp. 1P02AB]|uniref:zinc dependent phospholipase C family protein n=1 Tax=Alkalihalobacillus sp. 1P02AB TaxID=3132260 RepID=UPI0039A44A63
MGSRIMHLIIANRVANQLSITKKSSFLIGGVAPDAVSPKDLSHFFVGDFSDYSRRIDFEGLLHKYSEYKQTDYLLGYYSHLIADDIWLKGFYLPWLKNRLENDREVFQRYHNDFHLLNGKLIDYYVVKDELEQALQHNNEIIDLEEVTVGDIRNFTPYVLEDMNFEQSKLKEPLKVFTLDQIIGYIETSVQESIRHIHLRSK